MWSGFSSEIETGNMPGESQEKHLVACGAASHLRLKLITNLSNLRNLCGRMWSGFSSEIETRAWNASHKIC